MNRNSTENSSDQLLSTPSRQRRGRVNIHSLSKNLLHARALLRMARTRQPLALAIAITTGAAISTVAATGGMLATQVAYQVELHASVAPLAPPPHPTLAGLFSKPVMPAKHRRLLPSFHLNPLAGFASWYGSVWNGRKTASGETYDESLLTAAHKSLPLGTLVRVTNLRSMRSVIVRINDRGALPPNRVIDLSSAAAREIGMLEQGLASVKLEILGHHRS